MVQRGDGDCANGYAAYILELVEAAKETCAAPVVLIEQRVDFSRWVEQGFGTSDAIIIQMERSVSLTISMALAFWSKRITIPR